MKKKTKRKFLIFLWLLIGVAFLALFLAPAKRPLPKASWRVPVEMALPEIKLQAPELKTLPFSELFPDEQKEKAPEPPVALPPPQIEKAEGEVLVAIIIDDMGLLPGASRRAIRLPVPVTLSFLPYAPDVQKQVDEAKKAGHEILLHMPMEPLGRQNPGPDALMTHDPEDVLEDKMSINLNRFDGFVGVNNHMGSKFTMDRKAMKIFSEALLGQEVFFIDSRTSSRSIAAAVVRESGIKAAERDVFLDDTVSPAAIAGELARLERVARQRGQAIAIGHPHAATLSALEKWLLEAQEKGVRIVPVGQLVR